MIYGLINLAHGNLETDNSNAEYLWGKITKSKIQIPIIRDHFSNSIQKGTTK